MIDRAATPSLLRLSRFALALFPTLVLIKLVAKWILADSLDAWLNWLEDDWAAELIMCFGAALLIATAYVFGLSNNRYVDHD